MNVKFFVPFRFVFAHKALKDLEGERKTRPQLHQPIDKSATTTRREKAFEPSFGPANGRAPEVTCACMMHTTRDQDNEGRITAVTMASPACSITEIIVMHGDYWCHECTLVSRPPLPPPAAADADAMQPMGRGTTPIPAITCLTW